MLKKIKAYIKDSMQLNFSLMILGLIVLAIALILIFFLPLAPFVMVGIAIWLIVRFIKS